MVLEIINSVNEYIPEYLSLLAGGGTIGTIATITVQKFLNRKEDNVNVSKEQALLLKTVNIDLMEVVEKLQKIACYKDKCKGRVNGEENEL